MPPPECRVCSESYNSSANSPLFLPCGRSLCRACVLRWLQDPTQRCWVCCDLHKNVRLDDLKVDFDILEFSLPAATEPESEPQQQSDVLQLLLEELGGRRYQLKVPASATIFTVKSIIKDRHGFWPATTRLLFRGKVLQDYHTLTYYNVKTGNILQMVTNYVGGYRACVNVALSYLQHCAA